MSPNQALIVKFKNDISYNVDLSKYNWFNLGGPAEYLFKPINEKQLINFLVINKKIN